MTPRRSTRVHPFRASLIAPCGMNCRLCRAYMRDSKPCPGCRGDDAGKPKTRVTCRIKTCDKIAKGGAKYCFSCGSFPCTDLNRLDERYRTKYGMSMIDNLRSISKSGIKHFIETEKWRWTCSECGQVICVHEPQCLSCGHTWH